MTGQNVEEDVVRRAIERFSGFFGSEAVVKLVSIQGRVLEIAFSGHMCYTCGSHDYFDDYTLILEEISGTQYAVWDYDQILNPEPYFLVKLVKLDFLDEIRGATKEAGGLVKRRMEEFEGIGREEDSLFKELCFCILTANYKAQGGIRIQEALGDSIRRLQEDELAKRLRDLGYRFPETRARYIAEARRLHGKLSETLRRFASGIEAREWLVENVKGFGYKEASHFLRNIGFKDVAIVDRHILRFLEDKKLIREVPKSLNRTRYIRLEKLLAAVANILDLTLGELDLYLWYMKTGKVLK
jgi:N-glycosylase/DNA lyase